MKTEQQFLSEMEQKIIDEITGNVNNYSEISVVPHKRTRLARRRVRKQRFLAHRGTNWKSVKPKAGFKRVKIGKMYIRVRMGGNEKNIRRLVGRAVGKQSARFREKGKGSSTKKL